MASESLSASRPLGEGRTTEQMILFWQVVRGLERLASCLCRSGDGSANYRRTFLVCYFERSPKVH